MEQQPIPAPHPDDDEDVSWALSTASALWSRGEVVESLKWLRRAAEAASDANRDQRSLDLFKVAAEVTTLAGVGRTAAPSPPTPSGAPPPRATFPPPSPSQNPTQSSGASQHPPASRRPPGPPPRRSVIPPGAVQSSAPPPPPPPVTPRTPTPAQIAPKPPLTPKTSVAPPLPQQTSAVPPSGRSAPPPPPMRTPPSRPESGPHPGSAPATPSKSPAVVDAARVALRRGGPAAVGSSARRRDTADGRSKPRPMELTPRERGAPSGEGKGRSKIASELTSERATYAGIGGDPVAPANTSDDARTSPNAERLVSSPAESEVAIASSASEPAPSSTRSRRDEEITIQRSFFTPEQASAEAARLNKPSFDDLDEKTSVLTGNEPGVELAADSRTGKPSRTEPTPMPSLRAETTLIGAGGPPSARVEDASPTSSRTPSNRPVGFGAQKGSGLKSLESRSPPPGEMDSRETTNRTGSMRPGAPASTSDGIMSFRVAIVADQGAVQLILLRPGEPSPDGLATAFILPTDTSSSETIAMLLTRGGTKR